MYGVIMKHPTGNLMPFINDKYPCLREEDVYPYWIMAAAGGLKSKEFWKLSGCSDAPCDIEKEYLETIDIDESFYTAAERLKDSYRFALLSNDISEWSSYLRNKYRLDRFFDAVTISGDAKLMKPDKEIFNAILRSLNKPASECIFVDDRTGNLETAGKLGMDVVLFNSDNPGYHGKTADNFADLINLLLR